ncbi:MAG: DUF2304 domain-containing protein [Patescibacteria group bacterium]|jgi:hypothetical protein|nr:DUF2304 domain-containing protein [Patescibacteria group bacterium]
MLPQQIIAILIILVFVYQLTKQKKRKEIGINEYGLWLTLWTIAGLAIIFLKQIDTLLASIGLSASAINFLIYLSVLVLFYFVFKMRLTISKLDRNLTKLTRVVGLKEAEKEKENMEAEEDIKE